MPFPAGSLEDVEAWAQAEFPACFAQFTALLTDDEVETLRFDGEFNDGRVVLQPILVRALPIGCARTDSTHADSVYARMTVNSELELIYKTRCNYPDKNERLCWYMQPVVDIAEVELVAPFCYPVDSKHPAALDRLETLIRYVLLKCGDRFAVQPKLGFFKAHFRAARRDVAYGVGAVKEADEMDDDDDTLPDETPPDLIADTDIAGLRSNPAATSIFNQHVHAMDESYHDFKTGMLRQLAAMQAIDQNNMAQLHAQVQDLERRLALVEESRAALEKQLETKAAEAKTATEAATGWKTQYEGLKETLQGALGQRF
ncbi:hypothetical protein SVAN01_04172 [Stagonosporopsis vannaccii]|nr:hypothetical protein SVAN01_04172 [Stagonosporopsis vannaccii]